jgi:hypothetical protein
MTQKTAALATVPAQTTTITHDLGPQSIGDVRALANDVAKSKLFGVPSPEAALVIMLTGHELGLTVMQSLRTIHTIENKPVLSADLVVALCRTHPDCEFFRLKSCDAKSATWITKRRSEPDPLEMSFTWDDAVRAELTGKQNWKRYPADMLKARAAVRLGRAAYQERLAGLYIADELEPTHAAPQVRVAPMPPVQQPAPQVVHDADGVLVETEEDRVRALVDRMERATDVPALKVIGKEVAGLKASLSASAVATLAAAYKKQSDAFAAVEAERKRQTQPEPVEAELVSPAPPAVEEVGA